MTDRFVSSRPLTSISEQMADVGLTIVSIAELTELRALKAKVDGMKPRRVDSWLGPEDREQALTYNDLLAWLRNPE